MADNQRIPITKFYTAIGLFANAVITVFPFSFIKTPQKEGEIFTNNNKLPPQITTSTEYNNPNFRLQPIYNPKKYKDADQKTDSAFDPEMNKPTSVVEELFREHQKLNDKRQERIAEALERKKNRYKYNPNFKQVNKALEQKIQTKLKSL